MPAHPSVPPHARPSWSWGLLPALLACLAAPAFFVLRVPWLGWALLAAALGGALLVERRGGRGTDATPRPDRDAEVRIGSRLETARLVGVRRAPSLVRDLSLVALGLLIVSAIPLKAELDDLAFLR